MLRDYFSFQIIWGFFNFWLGFFFLIAILWNVSVYQVGEKLISELLGNASSTQWVFFSNADEHISVHEIILCCLNKRELHCKTAFGDTRFLKCLQEFLSLPAKQPTAHSSFGKEGVMSYFCPVLLYFHSKERKHFQNWSPSLWTTFIHRAIYPYLSSGLFLWDQIHSSNSSLPSSLQPKELGRVLSQ